MRMTDDQKVEPEVRVFIGLGYRTEDDVNIVEHPRGWCILRCFMWCFTANNGIVKGKYEQVWKIAEIHESSKGVCWAC